MEESSMFYVIKYIKINEKRKETKNSKITISKYLIFNYNYYY